MNFEKILETIQGKAHETFADGSYLVKKMIENSRNVSHSIQKSGENYISTLKYRSGKEIQTAKKSLNTIVNEQREKIDYLNRDARRVFEEFYQKTQTHFSSKLNPQDLKDLVLQQLKRVPSTLIRFRLPIDNYDQKTAKEIAVTVKTLTREEADIVRRYEGLTKNRKTILRAIEAAIA